MSGRRDESSHQPLYGALDLGTNNCRLLLATPNEDGFRVVEAFSRVTRLGEGLANSGLLSEAAIERTLCALRQCAQRVERREVRRLRSVATEACRRASNGVDFLRRVFENTGLVLETISAEDEAKLALAGCAPLLDRSHPFALVFDIGGGSTELIKVRLGETPAEDGVETVVSLPLGVVTLAEEAGERLHEALGYASVVDLLVERLRPFDQRSGFGPLVARGLVQMLGTSGTVTTLAGVHLDLPRYDRALVDGLVMEYSEVAAISRRLVTADARERAQHPCIGEVRADLVVAGCAILEAICRLWPADRLTVADRGVREGVLLSMMQADRLAARS
ncbi:exopolyphosphatase [Telmatospirillum siberiense]|uniref:Exopolyphosphatase n=2 Tax=Telmatospirillum siberiense TaxID=382514 RepID=A0A2N3PUE2_9PROT|nr:exopolyphosphatase [Telmatospirillum siberiense]